MRSGYDDRAGSQDDAGASRLAFEAFGPAEGLEHQRVEVVADAGVARSGEGRKQACLTSEAGRPTMD